MRVVAEQAFETYYELRMHQIAEGQALKGAMAAHVLSCGAPVREITSGGAAAETADPVGASDPNGAQDPEGSDVALDITGTAKEVLAWVGDDPQRAEQARDAEASRDKPRTTLLAALNELAN